MAKRHPLYPVLLGLTILLTLGGILTLMPNPAASKPNIFGYRSLCTFAPVATLLCFFLAGLVCTIRANYFKSVERNKAGNRFSLKKHTMAFRPLGFLLVLSAVAFGFWISADSAYTKSIVTDIAEVQTAALRDGTYSGSHTSGDVEANVELVVSGGKITAARLLSGRNVPDSVAEAIFTQVCEKQSLAVDSISGATASCSVVLKAAEAAISRTGEN